MTLSINQLKPGVTIVVDNQIFSIISYEHVKPGKGAAFVRVRLKNIKTEAVLERTYRSDDKIEEAFVDLRKLQYQYAAGNTYHFMDTENYEEVAIDKSKLGNTVNFLKEELEIIASYYDNQLLSISIPYTIVYKVVSAEGGVRGDTVKSGSKPAVLETGLTVQVPLFVKEGDLIKVDTRTGEYIERAV